MDETTTVADEPRRLDMSDLPEEELSRLARALFAGHLFTSMHIPEQDNRLLGSIFLPLALGALSGVPLEEIDKIGFVYEWMDKAGERSINGYPMFLSMKWVNRTDAGKIREKAKRLDEAAKAI